MVRKAFAPKANAEKAEEEKSDAPKKKKIVTGIPSAEHPERWKTAVESVRVRDVTTDAITVLRLDVHDKRDNRSNGGNKNGKIPEWTQRQ